MAGPEFVKDDASPSVFAELPIRQPKMGSKGDCGSLSSLNLARVSEFQYLLKDEMFSSAVRRFRMTLPEGEWLSAEASESAF